MCKKENYSVEILRSVGIIAFVKLVTNKFVNDLKRLSGEFHMDHVI